MTFRGVLFDLDGVILDSEPVSARVMQETARTYGFEVPDEAMDGYKGLPGDVVYGHIVETYGNGTVDAVTLRAARDARYEERLANVRLMPGVDALVRALHAGGFALAVVTSSRRAHAEHALSTHGLRAFFGDVVGSEDVLHPKPAPDPYREGARRLALDPADCVAIEDSVNGVRAARAAGCRVFGLVGSFARGFLAEAGAHRVFDTHVDVRGALGV